MLYWTARPALVAVGGGLAVVYDIENPILTANIGAATPAIVMTFARNPTTTSRAQADAPLARRPAPVRRRRP